MHPQARASHLDCRIFVEQLEIRTGVEVASHVLGRDIHVSWDQIRAMRSEGMGIGVHTHSHPILFHLIEAEQRLELEEPKRILETEVGETITALSDPDGGKSSFSDQTKRLARETSFRLAFSYYGGINRPGHFDAFGLKRLPVDRDVTFPIFRARTAMHQLMDCSVF
jgi:peptidoglycan/xylan/chitin deacetylase (PgdA/CDA1 family)